MSDLNFLCKTKVSLFISSMFTYFYLCDSKLFCQIFKVLKTQKEIISFSQSNKSKIENKIWEKLLRNVNMTDSKWPNEYDQKFWTWPKNSHQQTLTFEFDQNYNEYYHNDKH